LEGILAESEGIAQTSEFADFVKHAKNLVAVVVQSAGSGATA
jgi:hypothetical protein